MQCRRVDQIAAGFARGDAISQDALLLRSALKSLGIESQIYAPEKRIESGNDGACLPLSSYHASPDAAVIFHYSIGSEASALFLNSSAKKIVRYHNITPATYFAGYAPELAAELAAGRNELSAICSQADAIWADSDFNAEEIRALGFDCVSVLPLLFPLERFRVAPDPHVLEKFAIRMQNILFVGRMAPNKRVEDLILSFREYQLRRNPFSRLVLVGSERSCPRYFSFLRMLAGACALQNVCFEGFASEAGLEAYYRSADLFVCASEHEGYCLPLIEAMYHGIPVIAREAGGMPDALQGAGVMYQELSHAQLAELFHVALTDAPLRSELLLAQKNRIQALLARCPEAELGQLLSML